jgi:hypothetical protein
MLNFLILLIVKHNTVLVLRILTTHTLYGCILKSNKVTILLGNNVFYHYICITYYQGLNIGMAPRRLKFAAESCRICKLVNLREKYFLL